MIDCRPGIGFQIEAVQVLTNAADQPANMHSYEPGEETVLALHGEGEADVRGERVCFFPAIRRSFRRPSNVPSARRRTGPGLVAVAPIGPVDNSSAPAA